MSILYINYPPLSTLGHVPQLIYVGTNDTLATVLTPGYLNAAIPTYGNIFAQSQMAMVLTTDQLTVLLSISISGATVTLVEIPATGAVTSISGTPNRITVSPSTGAVVIDIASTYVGQTSITTLGTISTGVWGSSATPIGTTSGGTNITSYILGDTLYASASNVLSKLSGNITSGIQYLSQTGTGAVSAAPVWSTITGGDITGAALTRTDDTNITLTLGGSPATALLRATSITAGWAGLLSGTRGGTGINNGASTITLGGSLTTVGAFNSTFTMTGVTNVTFPTSGTLATTGGASIPSLVTGDMLYASATNTLAALANPGTQHHYLVNGSTATPNIPLWSAATIPTSATKGQILYASALNTWTGLPSATNGVLNYDSAGVPYASQVLENAVQEQISQVATAGNQYDAVIGNTFGTSSLSLFFGTDGFVINGVGSSVYAIGAATTTGTMTIGGTSQTGTITLGQSGSTNIVAIGSGTGATTVNIATGATNAKAVNIATGAVANVVTIGSTTGAASLTLNSGSAGIVMGGVAGVSVANQAFVTINTSTGALGSTTSAGLVSSISGTANQINASASTGAVTLSLSSTTIMPGTFTANLGAVNIGSGAADDAINIGTAASAGRTITIGNTTGATGIVQNVGTGNFILDGAPGSTYTIGASTTTGTMTIGGTAQTGTILIGSSSGTSIVRIGGSGALTLNLAVGTVNPKTINIGTGAIGNIIVIGTITGAASMALKVGTGNFSLDGAAGSTYAIGVSTTTGTITIGGTSQTGTITLGSSDGTNIVAIGAGTGATTVNIAGGATNSKVVNIGTGAVANTITLGNVTGATAIALNAGSGGVAINGKIITLGGNLTTSGAFNSTFTMTGTTSVTFPTSGTLATTGGASIPAIAQGDILYGSAANTLSALTKDTNATRYLSNTGTTNNPAWAQVNLANGVTGVLPSANGGTGVNNGASTITLAGSHVLSGAFTSTFVFTNTTNVTFPTSGTLSTSTGTVTSVGLSTTTGVLIGSTPVTTSGTITVDLPGAIPGQNLLFNGSMLVAQRGTSIAVAASTTVYTLDRWQVSVGASQISTVAQVASGTSGSFLARVQRNSGQTGTSVVRFAQSLTRDMSANSANNKITLSFIAACGADFSPTSQTITVKVYSGTGTTDISGINGAFTGSATPISTTQVVTTSPLPYTFTSGANVGSTVTQLCVEFSWTPVGTASTNDWVQFTNVNLLQSTLITNYQYVPYPQELLRCMYFYQNLMGGAGINNNSANNVSIGVSLSPPMRTIPTIGATGVLDISDGNAIFVQSSFASANGLYSGNGGYITLNNFAALAALRPILLTVTSNNNYITLTSELT